MFEQGEPRDTVPGIESDLKYMVFNVCKLEIIAETLSKACRNKLRAQ